MPNLRPRGMKDDATIQLYDNGHNEFFLSVTVPNEDPIDIAFFDGEGVLQLCFLYGYEASALKPYLSLVEVKGHAGAFVIETKA